MRKLLLGILGVFVLVVSLAVVAVKVRGQAKAASIIFLSADQTKALKQVDDSLVNLKKQFEDLQTQRAALITGFALSTPRVSSTGLEWGKTFVLEEAANGWGFRELSAEEQQARTAAQQQPQ